MQAHNQVHNKDMRTFLTVVSPRVSPMIRQPPRISTFLLTVVRCEYGPVEGLRAVQIQQQVQVGGCHHHMMCLGLRQQHARGHIDCQFVWQF